MLDALQNSCSQVAVQESYNSCCEEFKPISPAINKLVRTIEDLVNSVDRNLINDVNAIHAGIKEKCE